MRAKDDMSDASNVTMKIDAIDVKSLMMSNFQYRKCNLVCKRKQPCSLLLQSSNPSDVRQAVFVSACPSQHLER
jgi:hypothetical protein